MEQNKLNIVFRNEISVEEFNLLRKSVGWGIIEKNLAQKGIENSLYIIYK